LAKRITVTLKSKKEAARKARQDAKLQRRSTVSRGTCRARAHQAGRMNTYVSPRDERRIKGTSQIFSCFVLLMKPEIAQQ